MRTSSYFRVRKEKSPALWRNSLHQTMLSEGAKRLDVVIRGNTYTYRLSGRRGNRRVLAVTFLEYPLLRMEPAFLILERISTWTGRTAELAYSTQRARDHSNPYNK